MIELWAGSTVACTEFGGERTAFARVMQVRNGLIYCEYTDQERRTLLADQIRMSSFAGRNWLAGLFHISSVQNRRFVVRPLGSIHCRDLDFPLKTCTFDCAVEIEEGGRRRMAKLSAISADSAAIEIPEVINRGTALAVDIKMANKVFTLEAVVQQQILTDETAYSLCKISCPSRLTSGIWLALAAA